MAVLRAPVASSSDNLSDVVAHQARRSNTWGNVSAYWAETSIKWLNVSAHRARRSLMCSWGYVTNGLTAIYANKAVGTAERGKGT